jgi:hypothetical protein
MPSNFIRREKRSYSITTTFVNIGVCSHKGCVGHIEAVLEGEKFVVGFIGVDSLIIFRVIDMHLVWIDAKNCSCERLSKGSHRKSAIQMTLHTILLVHLLDPLGEGSSTIGH